MSTAIFAMLVIVAALIWFNEKFVLGVPFGQIQIIPRYMMGGLMVVAALILGGAHFMPGGPGLSAFIISCITAAVGGIHLAAAYQESKKETKSKTTTKKSYNL